VCPGCALTSEKGEKGEKRSRRAQEWEDTRILRNLLYYTKFIKG